MSTTVDTSPGSMILTIDEAAAYLAIRRRRSTPGAHAESGSDHAP